MGKKYKNADEAWAASERFSRIAKRLMWIGIALAVVSAALRILSVLMR